MRLPLVGGSYATRSVIASAARCINYFPEANPKDAPVPFTYYQRPGLVPLVSPGTAAAGRCIYRASTGAGYAVIGSSVYHVTPSFTLTLLGSTTLGSATPVSMVDNGTTMLVVDGSANGWTIDLATNAYAQVVDPSGIFVGADRVDFVDTFILGNVPGTNQFFSTLSNTVTFDATYVAGKTGWPDAIQSLIINRQEIVLLGTLRSEIWYDAGNPLFPFAELPGAAVMHGTIAKYSLAQHDISAFWLGQTQQGQGIVMRQRAYDTTRISNHALEYAIAQMAVSTGISDAIGYTYQQEGHSFYVLTFPAGNQTWVFDDSIGDPAMAWHQRAWTDTDGTLNRDRVMGSAFLYGKNIGIDWENGTLYQMDKDTYTDTVSGATYAISCIRSFPHITGGIDLNATGMAITQDGKRIKFDSFMADIDCGDWPLNTDGTAAQIGLRWSDDKGHTFGNTVLQAEAPGHYIGVPQWQNLGMARDRIFELSHSIAGPATLNGAWVQGSIAQS